MIMKIPIIDQIAIKEIYKKYFMDKNLVDMKDISGKCESRDSAGYFFFYDNPRGLVADRMFNVTINIRKEYSVGVMMYMNEGIPVESEVYALGELVPNESEFDYSDVDVTYAAEDRNFRN